MPELNREEFGDVKFYHGTDRDIDELLPADVHGGGKNFDISRDGSAYVTAVESDAWAWADTGRVGRSPGRKRVYEVEPYGDIQPDRNLDGPQFEVEGARITRELPGPINSQLALFPNEHGKAFAEFDRIAKSAEYDATRDEMRELTRDRGFQGVPQDTTLFDDDPVAKAKTSEGKLPYRAVPAHDPRLASKQFKAEYQSWSWQARDRDVAQEAAGSRLRQAITQPVSKAPPLDETFGRL